MHVRILSYEFLLRWVVFATLLLLYVIQPALGWLAAAAVAVYITGRLCLRRGDLHNRTTA